MKMNMHLGETRFHINGFTRVDKEAKLGNDLLIYGAFTLVFKFTGKVKNLYLVKINFSWGVIGLLRISGCRLSRKCGLQYSENTWC